MKRQFCIPGTYAPNNLVELPRIDEPFRILAIAATVEPEEGTSGNRIPYVRITYGGLVPVAEIPCGYYDQSQTVRLTWARGIDTQMQSGGSTLRLNCAPLPDIILDSRFRVFLACENEAETGIMTDINYLIDLMHE